MGVAEADAMPAWPLLSSLRRLCPAKQARAQPAAQADVVTTSIIPAAAAEGLHMQWRRSAAAAAVHEGEQGA